MYYRKWFILMAVSVALPLSVAAQSKPADTPKKPIDTLNTSNDKIKILLYPDNTWSYYQVETIDEAGEVYKKNWITNQIFAYRNLSSKDIPETVELELMTTYEDYHAPIIGKVISKYGKRGSRNHTGVDIPLKTGEPIFSTFGGKVRYAQFNSGGYGNLVIIRHENGLETYYAHLSRINVKPDDMVGAGMVIGLGGSTGRSRGPHLHFEMRYHDQTFDPEYIIDFPTGDIRYQTFALNKSFLNIKSSASETLDEETSYDEALLAIDSPDGKLTSEDILNNISESQKKAVQQQKAAAAKPNTDPLYHTIKKGDNLGKIAKRYGTTIKKLCQLNKISENTMIREGKKLRVR